MKKKERAASHRGDVALQYDMEYLRVTERQYEGLRELHAAYKREIGENAPSEEDFTRLFGAVDRGEILFFGCAEGDRLVGCCSVSPVFSTYDYGRSGLFEDFYILPEWRHSGIARELVRYAFRESGVSTLIVGSAECDRDMYVSLGFVTELGHMLAFHN